MTVINNTDVRTAMLNRTFATLSPAFPTFNSTVWEDWFQVKLVLLLPSINTDTLETIPNNISCDSYQAILSPSVLQGFSSSAMQNIPNNNIVNIVKACRGKKVPLVEDQAFNNNIPEDQLQLLGATSRVASVSDINSWTIATIDTLSALMKSEDGRWDADKSAAIITKYLGAGKTLDAVALKAIGGENLCSLSVSQLKNITAPNLRDAGALDISSCTPEKKKELYNTASAALISQRSDVLTYYNLIKPYLGEFHCSSL
ncbi:UNVERIFIED_CONTAM: hypothetical protein FKN15_072002 [Acipenser sinensis]